jgi:hypothetical protein
LFLTFQFSVSGRYNRAHLLCPRRCFAFMIAESLSLRAHREIRFSPVQNRPA